MVFSDVRGCGKLCGTDILGTDVSVHLLCGNGGGCLCSGPGVTRPAVGG